MELKLASFNQLVYLAEIRLALSIPSNALLKSVALTTLSGLLKFKTSSVRMTDQLV